MGGFPKTIRLLSTNFAIPFCIILVIPLSFYSTVRNPLNNPTLEQGEYDDNRNG